MPEDSSTSRTVEVVEETGSRLHHHVHVILKEHQDKHGKPRELEGALYTVVHSNDSEPKLPKTTNAGKELKPYVMKRRGAWIGEILQREPIKKRERLVMATDKPLDMAEDVNYSRTPSGALRLGLILLAILGIVEWWQIGAIQNAQGLDTGQLASKWAFFFWGCLLFGFIALVALSKTKSGRRMEFHCLPQYKEFCKTGNHVGVVSNSTQKSVFDQVLDFVGTFEYPTMDFLRESLISLNESQEKTIARLQVANEEMETNADYIAQTNWSSMSKFSRVLNEVVDPPDLRTKGKIPDWLLLVAFLGFLAALFTLYPGGGG